MATLRAKYAALVPVFTERPRRVWAAAEAQAIGYGGIALGPGEHVYVLIDHCFFEVNPRIYLAGLGQTMGMGFGEWSEHGIPPGQSWRSQCRCPMTRLR